LCVGRLVCNATSTKGVPKRGGGRGGGKEGATYHKEKALCLKNFGRTPQKYEKKQTDKEKREINLLPRTKGLLPGVKPPPQQKTKPLRRGKEGGEAD